MKNISDRSDKPGFAANKQSRIPFLTRKDVLLIILLVLINLGMALFLHPTQITGSGTGYLIKIFRPGQEPEQIRLLEIPTAPMWVTGNAGRLQLEWRNDGAVRVASSTCPQQVCVAMGWSDGSVPLCCVPNGIVIEFFGFQSDFDGWTK